MRSAVLATYTLVLALLAGSPALVRAEVTIPVDEGFSFDCTVAPLLLEQELEQAIASKVARKWNLGAVSQDALKSKVTIRVCLDRQGSPMQMVLMAAEGPSREAVDRLFETARRAVNRAYMDGGLPLPAATDDTWRVLDLVFDANGMRAR